MLRRLAIPLLFLAPVLILGYLSLRLVQNERDTIEAGYREQAQTWIDSAQKNLTEPESASNAVSLHIPYPVTPPTTENELIGAFREAQKLPPEESASALNALLFEPDISEVFTTTGQQLSTLISHQLLEVEPLPAVTERFLENLFYRPTELTALLLERSRPSLVNPDPELLAKISSKTTIYEKLRHLSNHPQGEVFDWPEERDYARFSEKGVTVVSNQLLAKEINQRIGNKPPPEWLAYSWQCYLTPTRGPHFVFPTKASSDFNISQPLAQHRGVYFTLAAYADHDFLQAAITKRLSRLTLILFFTLLFTLVASTVAYLTLRKQQQLSALQSDFVASVSHELRTPITSIRLLSERLKNETLSPEKSGQYHSLISNESVRLGQPRREHPRLLPHRKRPQALPLRAHRPHSAPHRNPRPHPTQSRAKEAHPHQRHRPP